MLERLGPGRLVAWRWFDLALAVGVAAVALVEPLTSPDAHDTVLAAAALVLMAAPVVIRRSRPLAAAWVQVAVLLATSASAGLLPGSAALAASVVAYSCGAHADRRRGLLGVAALLAALQVNIGFADFPNVELAFLTLGPWWVGSELRRRRKLVSDLAERTEELEAAQEAFTRLSVRRERARIARELHDIVAHHLAVIVVQAGAGRLAPPGHADEAGERFVAIRESGGQALAEMACLVDLLDSDAGDGATGLGKLRVLIEEANAGRADVRFAPLPGDVRVPAEVEDAAYHIVREALTNATKHAPGATVHVRLESHEDALEVEVANTVSDDVSDLAATGSGLGLAGMRERVESLGGSLDAGRAAGGGWCVRARLPVAVHSRDERLPALPPAG